VARFHPNGSKFGGLTGAVMGRQKLPIRQKPLHERADFADYGMAVAMTKLSAPREIDHW
jgi:hypothetical protein